MMTRFQARKFAAELSEASPTKVRSGLLRSQWCGRLYRLRQVALALIGGDEMWRQLWATHKNSVTCPILIFLGGL